MPSEKRNSFWVNVGTFCELESSKIPLKTFYECQQILFRQDPVNINLVDVGFYAQFAQSILTQSLMVFKIKLRKERPMDTGNVVNSF